MKRLAILAALFAASVAVAQTVTLAPLQYQQQRSLRVGTTAVTYTSGTAGSTIRTPQGDYRVTASGQLAARKVLTVCLSKDPSNDTAALVAVRLDGTAPLVPGVDAGPIVYPDAGTAPRPYEVGTVLAWGDCVSYPVAGDVVPKLISTVAGQLVTVFEGI